MINVFTKNKLDSLTTDVTVNTHRRLSQEFVSNAMELYREITEVFIHHNMSKEDSYVISQSLAVAIKTYLEGLGILLESYKKEEIYSDILNVFIRKKARVDESYIVMQALADSIYQDMTNMQNPLGLNVIDLI